MPVGEAKGPHPLDMLAASPAGQPQWPSSLGRVRPWLVQYLAWDGQTACQAVVVLPAAWAPSTPPPAAVPLLISPHGRNNFGWNNAVIYWQELPADGQFALICPDGLERAHDPESDPFDAPPSSPSLFTYGYPGHVDDLARMPSIVAETLPWLPIDMERIYVLGSSMGGQETLLLAARYPDALAGGTGRLAGAAAFDSPCDMPTQCGYLSQLPLTASSNPPGVAAMMLEEIGSRPVDLSAFNQAAVFYNSKTQTHWTIGQLLDKLPEDQGLWDERSPITYTDELANLPFPLRLYWSSNDTVVGNQAANQSGKLYDQIQGANPNADVQQVEGNWAHSVEFVPGDQLGEALRNFALIA
jgi:pimeloyl-ACP methyl ester carboxylesterase